MAWRNFTSLEGRLRWYRDVEKCVPSAGCGYLLLLQRDRSRRCDRSRRRRRCRSQRQRQCRPSPIERSTAHRVRVLRELPVVNVVWHDMSNLKRRLDRYHGVVNDYKMP